MSFVNDAAKKFLEGQPVSYQGKWCLVSKVKGGGHALWLDLIASDGARIYEVDAYGPGFDAVATVRESDLKTKAADERYGEQALASAIGEWSDLLAEANEVLDHKDYETLDSRKLDLGRALVRATSSAMKHTAEAAKMVHASRAKNGG